MSTPVDLDAGQTRGLGENGAGAGERNAELVLGLAGRDLGVGLGVDVGIDAERDRRVRAHGLRDFAKGREAPAPIRR